MAGAVLAAVFILAPLGAAFMFKPKQLWWTFSAWKYEHPDANEPSEDAYFVTQIGGGILVAAAAIIILVALSR